MKIVTFIQYFVYLIPALVAGIGVLSLFGGRQSFQAHISAGLEGLKSRIPAVLGLTLLYVALFMGVNLLRNWTEASTVIGFNYKEASQGLNPNSTRFNTYDIISDDVLEEALRRLDSGMSVRLLRSTLSVYPLAAGEELSAEQYYVSTEYVLAYTARFKTLLMNPRKTVDTIAAVYNEQFLDAYQRKTTVLDVDLAEVDAADYPDKPSLMEEMAAKIQEYMQGCQYDDPSFRSSTGENFGDVGTRASKFMNVTLERLRAYILSNGVSDNRQQYISRLNYDNTIKKVSYQKNYAAYEVRLNAINYYERDLASIVLVPTRDENGEFYMGRTKVGVDNFAVEAESYMESATNLQKTIETNEYEIRQLQQGENGSRSAVDQLLDSAKQELQGVSDSARQILQEYDASNARDILVITPQGRSFKLAFRVKQGGALTAAFLVAALLLFIARPAKKRRGRPAYPVAAHQKTGRL